MRHVCGHTQAYPRMQDFKRTLHVQVGLKVWLQSSCSTNASGKQEEQHIDELVFYREPQQS